MRPSGGYRQLRSFQITTIIYDATVSFCGRFIDRRSRTVDQMVQAARSGRQNIAEGSRAAATSSQTELRLVSVARASLEELLLDYEDHLRQRGFRLWTKDEPLAMAVRAAGRTAVAGQADYSAWLQHHDSAVVANAVICLIHQANYLLDLQVTALERGFIHAGGYSEQLAAARTAQRRQADRTDSTNQTDKPKLPTCRLCGRPMVVRTARSGANAGAQFWGCSGYPQCKATAPIG